MNNMKSRALAALSIVGLAGGAFAAEPDYSTSITALKTSLQTQLETNAAAIFGVMALTIGISLLFRLVRRVAK